MFLYGEERERDIHIVYSIYSVYIYSVYIYIILYIVCIYIVYSSPLASPNSNFLTRWKGPCC